ncbi:uncharacterized protein [Dermacentor albipictus]|uniref:uncharacterized protein n=1 Tax=Dermacentor albipictus TaxID=60249 RepID=UPI0031FD3ABF
MTWLVGMRRGSQSENASPALCTTAKRATGRQHGCCIPSPKRLFAAGILLDKVDYSMARRMAEQQADTTGRQICLVEQGFTGRGDTSYCKAAIMLRNIQGNIGLFGILHDIVDEEHGHHAYADDIFLQPQLSSQSSIIAVRGPSAIWTPRTGNLCGEETPGTSPTSLLQQATFLLLCPAVDSVPWTSATAVKQTAEKSKSLQ